MPSLLTLDWPPELMVKLATEAAGLTYDIQVSSSTVDLDNPVSHRYMSWESVPMEQMSDVISRRLVSGERAMVAQVFFKKGGVVPLHQHENEQITYILEGALQFELEGRTVTVRKGEVLVIPSNVPHRAVALEDTLDLDIFAPPRADWLSKNDEYLRRGTTEPVGR